MRDMVARKNAFEAPVSNTGCDSQNRSLTEAPGFSVAIDWIDFTLRSLSGPAEATELVSTLELIIGERLNFLPYRAAFNGVQWDGSGRSVNSAMAWYRTSSYDSAGELVPAVLKIAVPGALLSPEVSAAIARWLRELEPDHEFDCTRIDVALDDHAKFISLGKIAAARKAGNFFNCSYSERICSGNRGQSEGITLYFGSRSSDKRLRIYDKSIESHNAILGNRWEAQFRRKSANEVFRLWLEASADGEEREARLLQNIVVGLVDFRRRSDDDTDRNRCERLPWFERFIKVLSAQPARISLKPVERHIQRSIGWVERSVSSTLAMIKISLQADFMPYIERMIGEGAAKLSMQRRELAYLTPACELLY